MFEGDHDVVGDEVGYLGEEFVLVLSEEVEVLLNCWVAFDCDHEDADESGDWEDGVWGDWEQFKYIFKDSCEVLFGYLDVEEVVDDLRRELHEDLVDQTYLFFMLEEGEIYISRSVLRYFSSVSSILLMHLLMASFSFMLGLI